METEVQEKRIVPLFEQGSLLIGGASCCWCSLFVWVCRGRLLP